MSLLVTSPHTPSPASAHCPERRTQPEERQPSRPCRLPKNFSTHQRRPTARKRRGPKKRKINEKIKREPEAHRRARLASRGTSRAAWETRATQRQRMCVGLRKRFLRKEETVTGSSTRESPHPSIRWRKTSSEGRHATPRRKTSGAEFFVGINQKTCARGQAMGGALPRDNEPDHNQRRC